MNDPVEIIVVYLLFPGVYASLSAVVGIGARNRGRAIHGWWALALLITPIIAGFALVVLGRHPLCVCGQCSHCAQRKKGMPPTQSLSMPSMRPVR